MADRTDSSIDYISSMPETIIHNILSFLPPKDVIRTTILSKTWKQMLDSYPFLEFHLGVELHFDRLLPMSYDERQTELREILQRFEDYGDSRLFRFSISKLILQKLSLVIDIPDIFVGDCKSYETMLGYMLEKWVALGVKNGVKELSLCGEVHYLPKIISGATSLTVLTLSGCKLKMEESCSLMFPSLLKLSLDRVVVKDDKLSEFINGCPLIEDVFISRCWGVGRLQIFGLRKLKKVILDSNREYYKKGFLVVTHSVEIESPSLENFSISNEVWPCAIKVDGCKCLRTIAINGLRVDDDLLRHLVSLFHISLSVKIVNCDFRRIKTIKEVTVSSWRLKSMEIWNCTDLVKMEIYAPNLLSFRYFGSQKSVPKINAPSCQQHIQYRKRCTWC